MLMWLKWRTIVAMMWDGAGVRGSDEERQKGCGRQGKPWSRILYPMYDSDSTNVNRISNKITGRHHLYYRYPKECATTSFWTMSYAGNPSIIGAGGCKPKNVDDKKPTKSSTYSSPSSASSHHYHSAIGRNGAFVRCRCCSSGWELKCEHQSESGRERARGRGLRRRPNDELDLHRSPVKHATSYHHHSYSFYPSVGGPFA
jgi:hypothetical protein